MSLQKQVLETFFDIFFTLFSVGKKEKIKMRKGGYRCAYLKTISLSERMNVYVDLLVIYLFYLKLSV